MNATLPQLKLLHPESALASSKLAAFEKLSTETITASLLPGRETALEPGLTGLYSREITAFTSCESVAWMGTNYRARS